MMTQMAVDTQLNKCLNLMSNSIVNLVALENLTVFCSSSVKFV